MALLLFRLRRSPFLLRRFCSTFNFNSNSSSVVDGGPNSNCTLPRRVGIMKPSSEKWKQLSVSLLSFRDRCAIDARLLSEKINSRQAFINETIKNLENLSNPNLPPEIISWNLNRLDRLVKLKDILVMEDEMSAELANSRLTRLQEVIMSCSDDDEEERLQNKSIELYKHERWSKYIELKRLRRMELSYNSNPTLLCQTLKVLCLKLNTFNRVMRLKEMVTNNHSGLTSFLVHVIFNTFSQETSQPPPLDEGWRNTWNELHDKWNELYQTLIRLSSTEEMEIQVPTSILCQRLNHLNRLMRLKDMLVKEDELSAVLTNSRLTSLQEIINNFSQVDDEGPLNKWNELNQRLAWLHSMEAQDSHLLAMRSNSELASLEGYRMRKQPRPPSQNFGIVGNCWIKPPLQLMQTACAPLPEHHKPL
ncbi:uncharacterized protein LOC130722138 [Lotus japonicus]|nr:uncharacterized protein LOC130722045 [Lotus japonicus]XP_057428694.1 uncharacterized protein LOC130722088 [Lotus japonicus]XP_057428760.1 uncharacterized protein LOC130722138 [Lotus japonicus]